MLFLAPAAVFDGCVLAVVVVLGACLLRVSATFFVVDVEAASIKA